MSWLLFLDESGHDHKNCPYEVRGGVAVHASKLWPFVQRLQTAELSAFGANMREYSKELKGSKLLDKDRFKWAKQAGWMANDARRRHARGFLTKGWKRRYQPEMSLRATASPTLKWLDWCLNRFVLAMRAYSLP